MKKPTQTILNKACCYKYIIDGAEHNVAEMDRGQLMRALIDSIDLLDEVQSKLGAAARGSYSKSWGTVDE